MHAAPILLALVVALAPAGSARAAAVHTPPLSRATDGTFVCNVANASTKPREVVISILDPLGEVVAATLPSVLDPGQLLSVNQNSIGGRSCRVDVKGGRNTVRVSLYVLDANGNPTAAVQGQ
jgi:hypothetical protein